MPSLGFSDDFRSRVIKIRDCFFRFIAFCLIAGLGLLFTVRIIRSEYTLHVCALCRCAIPSTDVLLLFRTCRLQITIRRLRRHFWSRKTFINEVYLFLPCCFSFVAHECNSMFQEILHLATKRWIKPMLSQNLEASSMPCNLSSKVVC